MNWPIITSYGGDRISYALYRHGVTGKRMKVTLVMDQEKNNEFNIDFGK